MSHYGMPPAYEEGWDKGYDEASERHEALIAACRDLVQQWPTNKNLGEIVQRIAAELKALP